MLRKIPAPFKNVFINLEQSWSNIAACRIILESVCETETAAIIIINVPFYIHSYFNTTYVAVYYWMLIKARLYYLYIDIMIYWLSMYIILHTCNPITMCRCVMQTSMHVNTLFWKYMPLLGMALKTRWWLQWMYMYSILHANNFAVQQML